MKNILKNKLTLATILMICILSFASIVNAFSVTMNLTTTSKLKPGEVVEVVLNVSSIDAGEGINSIEATLEYDKNIFDEVTEDNLVGINKWKVQGYNEENGMFTALRNEKVNTSIDMIQISLRVKENVNVDKTDIIVKDIRVSGGSVEFGGTGDIEVAQVNVSIIKDNTSTEKPPVTNEIANEVVNTTTNNISENLVTNNITNSTTNIVTNKVVTNTNNGGTTGRLPQTGESIATYVAGISIITVIAIIAFIKYRNINV